MDIKDGAYIGAGSMIRQGQPGQPLVIGRNAIVGMGAVVLENVPDGATVVGAPAKIIEKSASYSPPIEVSLHEKSIKMVGTTGIEPVTPTMSR